MIITPLQTDALKFDQLTWDQSKVYFKHAIPYVKTNSIHHVNLLKQEGYKDQTSFKTNHRWNIQM